MSWSEPMETRFVTLWNDDGMTASQIAEQLNREFRPSLSRPVTRNSVIGMKHRHGSRLGLHDRQSYNAFENPKWTAPRDEILVRMWNTEGAEAKEIAEAVGLSRTAVEQRIHKLRDLLKLQRRRPARGAANVADALTGPRARKEDEREPPAQPAPPAQPEPEAPPADPVTLLERRENQCCWPVGEPDGPDTLMCGHPVEELGKPYCEAHRKRAWTGHGKSATKPSRERA